MFDHPHFHKYSFEEIPLNRDLYLIEDIWLREFERSLVTMFEGGAYETVGYISYAAARSVSDSSAELSWYPNIHTRFHEVLISLPRNQFITCVGCDDYDIKPYIFVKSGWLEHLYLQSYSVFALVDAVDVKDAIKEGALTREKLIRLRDQIDAIAAQHTDISFVSFADSLLLKSNWHVGVYDSEIKYSYEPEIFIRMISKIQSAYHEVLGLSVYAVLTQGANAYYDDPLLHISAKGNHISLNSLGLPFAQLMSIDKAARAAIKEKVHNAAELYMDKNFFHSLRLVFEFDKRSCGRNIYREPLIDENSLYFFADCQHILKNIRNPNS